MADSQRKTANLFDLASWIIANGSTYTKDGESYTFETKQSMYNSPYYFSETDIAVSISGILKNISSVSARIDFLHADGTVSSGNVITDTKVKSENIYAAGLRFNWSTGGTVTLSNIMLNEGTTALPYEPYGWLHSLRKLGTSTDTITTLPADLYADGTNASTDIIGNMVQTGTPTPTTPIQPQECGERTGNLFYGFDKIGIVPSVSSGNDTALSAGASTDLKEISDPAIVLTKPQNQAMYIFLYDESQQYIGNTSTVVNNSIYSSNIIGYENAKYYRIRTNNYAEYQSDPHIMLNTGSTPLPYEPWGYKIPISSGGTTTPVYLGEVQSTRRIKKLVLTGTETWFNDWRPTSGSYGTLLYSSESKILDMILCTHLPQAAYNDVYRGTVGISTVQSDTYLCAIRVPDTIASSDAEFKAWLAAQYANGTPVCVWYVLAEPTTGIVNEPLRKIGDYADTVSGISIPTITGKDSFDVLTSLKPSEVSLAYTGWHDASVKEWDGSEWQ